MYLPKGWEKCLTFTDAGLLSKERTERYVQGLKEAIDREGGRQSYCVSCRQWWKFKSQIVEMYKEENGYHWRERAKCPRCGKDLDVFHRITLEER